MFEVIEIRRDVQRETVRAHPTGHAYANGGELSAIVPYAGKPGLAPGDDPIGLESDEDRFLQRSQICAQVCFPASQIDVLITSFTEKINLDKNE